MKSVLYFSAAVGCMLFTAGCCKSIMNKEQATTNQSAETIVQDGAESQVLESLDPATESEVKVETTDFAQEDRAEPSGEAGVARGSATSWIAFSAALILIGWLAHKFIFRKR